MRNVYTTPNSTISYRQKQKSSWKGMQMMQRIRDYKIHLLYYIAQYLQPIVSKSWKHLFLPIIYPLSTWYNYLAIGILHLPAQSSELFCKDKHAVGDGKGVCTPPRNTRGGARLSYGPGQASVLVVTGKYPKHTALWRPRRSILAHEAQTNSGIYQ